MKYKVKVRKPEEKRPLRRTRYREVDNNRMNLRKTGWQTVQKTLLT